MGETYSGCSQVARWPQAVLACPPVPHLPIPGRPTLHVGAVAGGQGRLGRPCGGPLCCLLGYLSRLGGRLREDTSEGAGTVLYSWNSGLPRLTGHVLQVVELMRLVGQPRLLPLCTGSPGVGWGGLYWQGLWVPAAQLPEKSLWGEGVRGPRPRTESHVPG